MGNQGKQQNWVSDCLHYTVPNPKTVKLVANLSMAACLINCYTTHHLTYHPRQYYLVAAATLNNNTNNWGDFF